MNVLNLRVFLMHPVFRKLPICFLPPNGLVFCYSQSFHEYLFSPLVPYACHIDMELHVLTGSIK